MKCYKCGNEVGETFLGKINGTYIGRYRDKRVICRSCMVSFRK